MLDLRNLLQMDGPGGNGPPTQPQTNQQQSSTSPVALDEEQEDESEPSEAQANSNNNKGSPCRTREERAENAPLQASPSPVVAMVTKHANGTLNLWHLALSDQSKFTQVLSVSHATRISGHRFRVNNITCHPVLPLLLTTSHHNIINSPNGE